MGKPHLGLEPDLIPAASAPRGRAPFTDAVEREDRRLVEGAGVEAARGMRLVVRGEADRSVVAAVEPLVDLPRDVELSLEPDRHRLDERRKTPRGEGKRGLQKPLELHERLLVEDHGVEVGDPNPRLLQAPPRHLGRKRVVVLAACEPLLLSGRHDATVLEQRRRAVVKERRDAEDVHGAFEMKNPGRPSRPTGASE